jgi:hypothetical protein
MDENPRLSRDDGDRIFQQVMSHFDAPAYIRRARRVQAAFDVLVADCHRQRDEWLTMAVVHLHTLRGLVGTWDRLLPCLADVEQVGVLQRLWDELKPDLQVCIEPTTVVRKWRRCLRALVSELEEFNRRWSAYLPTVDLGGVNELRDGYNRYYVLEKECAVRSLVVARHGFRPLPPLTTQDLIAQLPPLPVPRTRSAV